MRTFDRIKSDMTFLATKNDLDRAFISINESIKEVKKNILKNNDSVQIEINEMMKNKEAEK